MQIFEYLHQAKSFEHKHLTCVETREDSDMLILIGLYQTRGEPITMKQIVASEIGSAATLERRLARFKRLGIVNAAKSKIDRRNIHLKLNAKFMRVFQRYGSTMSQSSHYLQA